MKITNKQIKKYKEMVDQNNHGELLEEVAKDLGAQRFMNLFKNINQIHAIEVDLRPDLHAVRNRIREDFKSYLQQTMTENYEIVRKFI